MENSKLNQLTHNINNFKALYINTSENEDYFKNITQNLKSLYELLSEIDDKLKAGELKTIIFIINIKYTHLLQYFTNTITTKNSSKNYDYKFHHTEDDNLFLIKYNYNNPNKFPNYGKHQLGIGAFIINEDNKVLLVKEKIVTVNKLKGRWKIPTGRTERGESIGIACVREVYEETQLKVKFEGIVSFRETYPSLFDCTDIFFVCICSCNNSKDQIINLSIDDELEEYRWFTKQEIVDEVKNFADQNMIKFIINIFPDNIEKYLMKGQEYKFLNRFRMIAYRPNAKF